MNKIDPQLTQEYLINKTLKLKIFNYRWKDTNYVVQDNWSAPFEKKLFNIDTQ